MFSWANLLETASSDAIRCSIFSTFFRNRALIRFLSIFLHAKYWFDFLCLHFKTVANAPSPIFSRISYCVGRSFVFSSFETCKKKKKSLPHPEYQHRRISPTTSLWSHDFSVFCDECNRLHSIARIPYPRILFHSKKWLRSEDRRETSKFIRPSKSQNFQKKNDYNHVINRMDRRDIHRSVRCIDSSTTNLSSS